MTSSALISPIDVVRSFPAHQFTLSSLFSSRVAANPDKEFLVYGDMAWTYAETALLVDKAVTWLVAEGVQAKDRIAVFSPNHPSTAVLFLALSKISAIMVPVNPDFGVNEARYVLANSGARGVICAPETCAIAKQAIEPFDDKPWIVLNEGKDAEHDTFETLIQNLAPNVPNTLPSPDDTCVFIYSSGTTGAPKGAMHGQRGYVITAESFVVRLYLQPTDRILCVLPLFHINALFYSLGGTMAAGATLVLSRKFSASSFWQLVSQTRSTTVNLIGAAASILTKRDRSEFVPGHQLKKAFIAPLDQKLLTVFTEEFQVDTLIECYGMTEIPGVLSNPFLGPRALGSMGKVSPHLVADLPQPELRIVDENFNDVRVGEQGQLLVKTPTLMQGYYADQERSDAAFHDGWFITGDIARQDSDGFYWFIARQKDVIRCRGENISGAELDRVISEHPNVLEVATIGVPAPLGEEDVMAVVVPKPGAQVSANDIADWVKGQLAPIKIPAYVCFTEAIPKTPTHRVEKYKLKTNKALLATATATYAAR